MSARRLLAALSIPKRGEVVELALPLYRGAPSASKAPWEQRVLPDGATEAHRRRSVNRDTYLEEVVSGSLHSGCHVDALGHSGVDGRFYGGRSLAEIFDPAGLRALGAEEAGPWVTRGICLDIPGALGAEHLEDGFAIEPEHLDAACERRQIEIKAGDAVLLHTGWARLYESDPARYMASEPGASLAAARRLSGLEVSLLGADNWGFEVYPSPLDPRPEFPAHQHLLAEAGTHILENIDTRPLVELGAGEFLFLAAPAKVRGATAAPVSPLAIL